MEFAVNVRSELLFKVKVAKIAQTGVRHATGQASALNA